MTKDSLKNRLEKLFFFGYSTAIKYFIGVVTGKGPQSTRITLETYLHNVFFDCVKTGSIEGPVKQERIEEVISETGAARSAVRFIGDAPGDITAS